MTAVPFALDATANVVTALTAPRGARYTCLECSAPLGVRRGEERRWHFFHLPGFERDCGGESVTHRAAKQLLAQALRRELEETGHVTWQQRCAGVKGRCRDSALLPRSFRPVGWTAVVEEATHGDFRFDVAVVAGKRVLFGLEVFFRHAVPEAKAAALDVPWLELLAEDLLAHRPRVPVRGDDGAAQCPACQERARLLEQRAEDDAVRGAVTGAFEDEAQRVADTWAAVLREARAKAEVAAKRTRTASAPAAPQETREGQAPASKQRPLVVEDETARARREQWATMQAWVNERKNSG
ncbi:hypothetical protein Dcar01_01801 [Deinococcus carri]|uniref:Nudix hydrolase domain-containing protein n=1 Tax=Deinococcus carri TaxID=1211323 RepID=A0ABP9W6T1_9DEIO